MVQELDTAIRQRGTAGSRRGLWRAAITSTFGVALLGLPRTSEAKKNRGQKTGNRKKVTLCHAGQTITVRKKAQKKHRKHGDSRGPCLSPASPPSPRLVFGCPGPTGTGISAPGNQRFAQTFTPSESGALHQLQFDMIEQSGTSGDYLVQLLQVTAGTPGNTAADILAHVVVPDSSVLPGNSSPLIANFSGPALAAGTKYAVAVSRPGSSNFGVHMYAKNGPSCDGGNFFTSEDGGPFKLSPTADDMVLSVFVI